MMDEIDYGNGYRQGFLDARQVEPVTSRFWFGLVGLGFLAVALALVGML